MIQITISKSVFDLSYPLPSYSVSGYSGILYPEIPYVVTGPPSEDPVERSVQWGYLRQGVKALGNLRDKDVSHLGAKGNIEYNIETDMSSFSGHLVVPHVQGTYAQSWSLPAGTATRRISGDDYFCWETGDVICELTVWVIGDHVIMSWCTISPAVYAHKLPYGSTFLLSPAGSSRKTYHYSFQGDSFYYRSLNTSGNFSYVPYNGTNYTASFDGMSAYATARNNDSFQLVGGNIIPNGDDSDLVPSELIEAIEYALLDIPKASVFSRAQPLTSSEDWGLMTMELADQLESVESNQLLNLLDLAGYADIAIGVVSALQSRDLAELAEQISKGIFRGAKQLKAWLKAASGVYLAKKYVADTTMSDVREVQAGVKKFFSQLPFARLHSQRTDASVVDGIVVNHHTVLTVEVGSYPTWFTGKVQEFIGKARRWGVYPEVDNLYDMLQYSFVVDWFVGFGDLVSSVNDYMTATWYFPVDVVIQSEKWTFDIDAIDLLPSFTGVTGVVQFKYYERWVSQDVPKPPVQLETGTGLAISDRGAQATALAIQRLR